MQKRLSNHAKERCKERFGISYKKIKEVMMYGNPPVYYDGPFRDYLMSIKNAKGGAITVKVKDEIVVIYNKRSQRAITTYRVPRRFGPSDDYLLPVFRKARNCEKLEEVASVLWEYINSMEVDESGDGSAEKSE